MQSKQLKPGSVRRLLARGELQIISQKSLTFFILALVFKLLTNILLYFASLMNDDKLTDKHNLIM